MVNRKSDVMGVDVRIKSKGLFKKKLGIKDVIFEDMRFGVIDDDFRLDENKESDNILVFNSKSIGRGIQVFLERGIVELRMSLPTGDDDILFFYEYINKLCDKMGFNTFYRNEEIATFDNVDKYIKDDIATSESALKEMKKDVNNGDKDTIYIFGALHPIALGKNEFKEIDGDTKKLGKFLHKIQSQDLYYAVPRVYGRNDGTEFGMYVLTEDVSSIFPYKASLFMNDDIEINEWYVSFVVDNSLAGTVLFEDFIKNVKSDKEYDAEHFEITLNKKEMEKILKGYRVEL